jgi:hypothetical protein
MKNGHCSKPQSACARPRMTGRAIQLSEPAVRPITLPCPSYPVAKLAWMAILVAGPSNRSPRAVSTAFRRFFFVVFLRRFVTTPIVRP